MTSAGLDLDVCPLIIGLRPLPADRTWNGIVGKLTSQQIGLVFALEHPADAPDGTITTDVIGVLTDGGKRRERAPNPAQSLTEAQSPGARLAGRRLRPT